MPPKTNNNELTEVEARNLANAFRCVEDPKVDMKKFAAMSGYTNLGSASNALNALKKKIRIMDGAGETMNDADSENAASPKTPKKRARANANGGLPTPKKSKKSATTPAKKEISETDKEHDDETEVV
ncbi:hypothetical protein F5Y14DRAFT_451317 [Nemania sp. NC0429]|nr:hypothetical protein F5Y14DRAFT_451317 [Nemania sp. NC0429]